MHLNPILNFTCGIDGCIRSYTNIGTFKNHLSAVHSSATANDLNRGSDISITEEPSQDEHLSSCDNTNDALDNTLENDTDSSSDSDDHDTVHKESTSIHLQNSHNQLQKSSALFLLGLKEKHKLTQATVQGIVEGVTTLTQQQISILKSQVCYVGSLIKDCVNTAI